ncbi:MAG: hypothetical protein E7536_09165 [Ruminococcaceae bacterium]|nr:hypothetical protein [Oscillospiraceae bacterium]
MQNEMRDRLIELLQSVPANYEGNRGVGSIADFLLENGVIVPPCKVGDTIYRTAIEYGEVWEWDIVEIQINLDEFVFIDDSENIFLETDIGKTVFPTKEEAEKALKEGADND